MVRDAVLDGADAGVLAGTGGEDSAEGSARVVPEAAASDSDWAGAGGMRTVVPAPVVPGRAVFADQGKTRSTVVHAVSDNAVLSIGDSSGVGGHGGGAVSVRQIVERKAGYTNSEGTGRRHSANADAVRNFPRSGSHDTRCPAVSVRVAGGDPVVLGGG